MSLVGCVGCGGGAGRDDGGSSRFEEALNKTRSLSRLRGSAGGRRSAMGAWAERGQLLSKSSANRSDLVTG